MKLKVIRTSLRNVYDLPELFEKAFDEINEEFPSNSTKTVYKISDGKVYVFVEYKEWFPPKQGS